MEKFERIAGSPVWHIFYGAERGLQIYVGDDESMKEFESHDSCYLAGFERIEKVFEHLGINLDETPLARVPFNRQRSGNPFLEPILRALNADYKRPDKEALDAFAAKHGKRIVLFALRRDMYDGLTVYKQFTGQP